MRCCRTCCAVYRSGFERCPTDGTALSSFDADPVIGTVINDLYEVEACVGEGAMGRVYRAHHLRLTQRQVALKILLGDLAASVAMRLRFTQEAQAASVLSHPNVVPVLDFGKTPQGLLFLAMEYVEGSSLARIIVDEGPLDPARVVRLVRQLCLGLGHAHSHGLVHRDFKPDNVLVVDDPGGEIPRIADFGLAIFSDTDQRQRPPHQRRHRRRHADVHGAGAGPGPRRRPPGRPVRARRRHVRDAGRLSALRGQQPGRGAAQQHGGAAPAHGGARARRRGPARARAHRAAADELGPRSALPVRAWRDRGARPVRARAPRGAGRPGRGTDAARHRPSAGSEVARRRRCWSPGWPSRGWPRCCGRRSRGRPARTARARSLPEPVATARRGEPGAGGRGPERTERRGARRARKPAGRPEHRRDT